MTQLRPCQRAYTWMKDIYAPTLLLYPMKNVGERGPNAQFVRISWDEALTTIAQNMQSAIVKYGPYSIGYGCGFMKANGCPSGNYIGAGHAEWGLQSFPPCICGNSSNRCVLEQRRSDRRS